MSADSVKLFLIIVSLNYILFYLTEIYFHMKFLFIYLCIFGEIAIKLSQLDKQLCKQRFPCMNVELSSVASVWRTLVITPWCVSGILRLCYVIDRRRAARRGQ